MDLNRPRKLNLNAPLLSTRRHGSCSVVAADTSCSSNSQGTIQNASERVPFSWEQAPGKPKDMERRSVGSQAKLPPCHWLHPLKEAGEADADQDDDDEFSDAMDVFSLSEALDIVQKSENDGLRLKLAESNGYQSPTYMINRFLPDATALAASSSALHFPDNFDRKICDTCDFPECYDLSGPARHSYAASSPKGCGLEFFFPWRVKLKLCAMKSPVLPCSTNLQKHHQRSSKQKKHHRSSTHVPCTNVKDDI